MFLAVLLLAAAVFSFFRIKNEADSALAQTRARVDRDNDIPFTKTARSSINNQQIQIWQNTQNVRAVVRFRGSVFAATDGGLLQLSEDGKLVRHFTVLDGLTESDLVCLAVFQDRLFIGTRSTGLLTFDGEQFENYVWRTHPTKSVNALLADDRALFIGTFAGGLIEFDGSRFREIKAENQSLTAINFLAQENQKLFVGTFDDGLWMREAGSWRHFTTAEGLPANRIVGVLANGENILVGTDLGVAETKDITEAGDKIFHTIMILPTLASLVKNGNQILAAKDNGEIFALVGERTKSFTPILTNGLSPNFTNAQLIVSENDCWLIGTQGIFTRERNSFARFGNSNIENQLASNTISALAVDANGKIWVGTFRQGIDVFASEGRKFTHLENETTREINFLLPDKEFVWAATAGGAVRFDKLFRAENIAKSDGLLSNSINQISAAGRKGDLFFATSRGLSLQTAGGWRGSTTVNGLPNNNAFTTLFYKNSLFVGTLGGLAELQDDRVVRTFSDANSALTHNWITALSNADSRLFIGTYGGGVFELTASGELRAFAAETGKFIVNPNAMFADGERLYVGTLEGAQILDLTTQKWTHLIDELPAQTVLSVTGDAENIYFGTTGGVAKINKKYFRTQK
ncbi:MAG: two-component regulator propeller domain-containing protein [Pyrinomonadaceae bacterium]